jgi:hypothetical protein
MALFKNFDFVIEGGSVGYREVKSDRVEALRRRLDPDRGVRTRSQEANDIQTQVSQAGAGGGHGRSID